MPLRQGIVAIFSLGLIAIAVWMSIQTVHEVRAEVLFEKARMIQQRDDTSPLAEVKFRQAYAQDPNHPEIMRALANNLIRNEKIKYSRRQLRSMSQDRIEEGLRLLARARIIYPFEPDVVRAHGETALMFGDLLTLTGDYDRAEEMYQVSFQALTAAARQLPVPRQSKEAFHAEIIRVAQLIGRQDTAYEFVHHMDKRGFRWILPDLRMPEAPLEAGRSLGIEPRVVREARWLLSIDQERNAAMRGLVEAVNLGEGPAAIQTLTWLDKQNELSPEARRLLNHLVSTSADDPAF
ncbi:hypothetical protein KQI84_03935 [bacterium]|nr:hypothetical protein [bacterium]